MRVLFLADCLGIESRHHVASDTQFLDFLPLAVSLAKTPHAPLLGPTLLATIIRDAGFEVTLLECAFRLLQRENLLKQLASQPEVVCITTTFIMDLEAFRRCTDVIRRHSPRSTIILGGPSLRATPEMKDLGDYCILGEGENAIIPLLQSIQNGEKATAIAGVSYLRPDGTRVENAPELIAELDRIPFPDWSLTQRTKEEFIGLSTQRGCAWRCAFCNYPATEGYQQRFRSVDSIIEEIRRNHERYGMRHYLFTDSTFTAPPKRCMELLRAIARLPFRIEWASYARVDTISPEMVDAMVSSGCTALFFGLESGDENILRSMKKRFTTEQVRQAVALLRPTGIKLTASWIVGWPGETPESVRRTVDFATELQCGQNSVHTFSVTQASPAQLRPELFALESPGSQWSRHSSMSYRQAKRWTYWAILTLLSRGLSIGSFFDFFWLSSLGLNTEEVLSVFRDAQAYSLQTRRLHNHLLPEVRARLTDPQALRAKLEIDCAALSLKAERHPIYRPEN